MKEIKKKNKLNPFQTKNNKLHLIEYSKKYQSIYNSSIIKCKIKIPNKLINNNQITHPLSSLNI